METDLDWIRVIGRAAYGERFVRRFAEDLGFSHAYVSQMLAGVRPVTDEVRARLRAWAADREAKAMVLRRLMSAAQERFSR